MSNDERPQITLITPPLMRRDGGFDDLSRILDDVEIACLRVNLATQDEAELIRIVDSLREIAHQRDVPVVIDNHLLMVQRLGIDGVHFQDGARHVRKARKELGSESIIGSFCGASRHEGLNAGESGADYITFGPVVPSSLGDGGCAAFDLFEWWSDMIEVPVVAEGGLTRSIVEELALVTDHFAIGPEIWSSDKSPLQVLKTILAPILKG